MRINNITNIYETYALQQASTRVNRSDGSNGESGRRDSIAVSSSARSFTTALQAILNAPDVREDLVADIRSQIENGKYQPDASKIADKILD